MDRLQDVLPLIRSYTGENTMNRVSSSWYNTLQENDRSILEALLTKYGDGLNTALPYIDAVAGVQEAMEMAIKIGDIKLVRAIMYEYSRYLPINWISLHRIATHTDMKNLTRGRIHHIQGERY